MHVWEVEPRLTPNQENAKTALRRACTKPFYEPNNDKNCVPALRIVTSNPEYVDCGRRKKLKLSLFRLLNDDSKTKKETKKTMTSSSDEDDEEALGQILVGECQF
ncbi:hypothetical protein B9Z55_024659 [Caenorhabditis nigoni]|uniref:Uncharacterized protein n=1 Tax=Caenorhabditis nigoni TaxID=1611254 RepID=A0A2G5SUZ2_9PELO|nr:hypothetical protein B9Z55_024659 [Caenorhabditis nigoni]